MSNISKTFHKLLHRVHHYKSTFCQIHRDHLPSRPKTSIDDLPNSCLHLILSNLPLSNILHVRSVCTQWRSVAESICATQIQHLRIFFCTKKERRESYYFINSRLRRYKLNSTNTCDISQHDLVVRRSGRFNAATCALLVRLFPLVSHLVIYLGAGFQEVKICGILLCQWTKLINLHLFSTHLFTIRQTQVILTALTSLDSLVNLNLYESCAWLEVKHAKSVRKVLSQFTLMSTRLDLAQALVKLQCETTYLKGLKWGGILARQNCCC